MTFGSRAGRRRLAAAIGVGAPLLAAVLIWLAVSNLQSARVVAGAEGKSYRVTAAGYLDGAPAAGSRDGEQIRDVAIDASGSMYLVGGTQSLDFPVTEGAYDTTFNRGGRTTGKFGEMDVFVAKLDPEGKIVWSTFLGGPNYDRAYAVEVDAAGNVYVAGRAGRGFPTTPGAAQTGFAGDSGDPRNAYGEQDGFVTKLAPDGSGLIWSTYFGDTASGFIRDIDIDANGNVHIAATAMTGALAAITPDAAQSELKGPSDAVYAKLSANGREILYATYYGGTTGGLIDGANPSIRVSPSGAVYMTAFTAAEDVPVSARAYQKRSAGGLDLTLAKYAPDGTLLFSTYLGGSGDDVMETHGLAVDEHDQPIVAGATTSRDFPTTEAAFQPGPGSRFGTYDGFIARISADGSRLLASTYLGGGSDDGVEGVALAPDGAVAVAGATASRDFPITRNAAPADLRERAFILTILDPGLGQIRYSTFFGGAGADAGRSIAVGADGEVAVGGQTRSSDFPLVRSFDHSLDGGQGAAYVRLAPVAR